MDLIQVIFVNMLKNYSDGYIKTSGFVFADSARLIVCFYLVLDGRWSINVSLKPLSVSL